MSSQYKKIDISEIRNGDKIQVVGKSGKIRKEGVVSNMWEDGRLKVAGELINLSTNFAKRNYTVFRFEKHTPVADSRKELIVSQKSAENKIDINQLAMIKQKAILKQLKTERDILEAKLIEIKKELAKSVFITPGNFIHDLDNTLELIKGKVLTDDLTGQRIHSLNGLNFEKNRINFTRSVTMTAGRTTRIKVG